MSIPSFAIQILLRHRPEWLGKAVAVVADEKPTASILAVNRAARMAGVQTGQRYSVALSKVPGLCAGAVPRSLTEESSELVLGLLHRFSPEVEPASATAGVFWLNADGLQPLFSDLQSWARSLRESLEKIGFSAAVVVGFSRFGTYAVARSQPGVVVFEGPAEEKRQARQVELSALGCPARLRDELERLGVRRVEELLRLPEQGVRQRYGKQAARLHRQAAGRLWEPLRPSPEVIALEARRGLDYPESDRLRLLPLLERMLGPLLLALHRQGRALERLELELELEDGDRLEQNLKTARPTLELGCILELVRLRLESLELAAGVVELVARVAGGKVSQEQLELFGTARRRDLEAANRALARIVAEFGEGAVARARLADGHLPEASFSWEALERLGTRPAAAGVERAVAIRRHYAPPRRLKTTASRLRMHGPYRLSGGWWEREMDRDYYYGVSPEETVCWFYFDRIRKDWFLEGCIG